MLRLFAAALTGCLIDDDAYQKRLAELADDDGDGVKAEFDCDDNDPSAFPEATERCDGTDNDCDGNVDESAEDKGIWFLDADGDGHGSASTTTTACTNPDGYVAVGDDCDDASASTHPEAIETPYDEIDQDCSGQDLDDVDGDGWSAVQAGGSDCDDGDPAIAPDASEVCADGTDQDCDGADSLDCDGDGHDAAEHGGTDCDDEDDAVYPSAYEGWHDMGIDNDCDDSIDDPVAMSLGEADVRFTPPATGGYSGGGVGGFADIDGDAIQEIWMSAVYDASCGAYCGAV